MREQLELYESMHCKLDMNHRAYRRLRLQAMLEQRQGTLCVVALRSPATRPPTPLPHPHPHPIPARHTTAEGVVGTSVYGSDPVVVVPTTSYLRCRKCRRPLFEMQHIVEHEPGVGQAAFEWRKQSAPANGTGSAAQCANYFVEPMAWMDGVDDRYTLEGKIACPKCAAKLGSFCWPGSQCSCGAWVAPAFMVHKKNVDAINLGPGAARS